MAAEALIAGSTDTSIATAMSRERTRFFIASDTSFFVNSVSF